MSRDSNNQRKRRLTAEETRARAVEAAHQILRDEGPQAINLKAVAQRVGCTHGNLLHHFGSVDELNREIDRDWARRFCTEVGDAIRARRAGTGTIRDTADRIFDAASTTGGAELVAWMKLSGNQDAHKPIMETVGELIAEMAVDGYASQMLFDLGMCLMYMALGDALMGDQLTSSQGQPRDRARELAVRMMSQVVQQADGKTDDWLAGVLVLNAD